MERPDYVVKVPLEFALRVPGVTWRDIVWAYDRGIISWRDVVEFARVQDGACPGDLDLFELTQIGKDGAWKVADLARQLAGPEQHTEEDPSRKWLLASLVYSYVKRSELPDPLGSVEALYADYGYPAEIEHFVGYMPPQDGYDPSKFSHEENVARLILAWRDYLASNGISLDAR